MSEYVLPIFSSRSFIVCLFLFLIFIYLAVLSLSCSMQNLSCDVSNLISLTRDPTWAPCIESVESQPFYHQASVIWCHSWLIFKSLSHFEFIFVYDVRVCSNFIDLHVTVQLSQYSLLKRLSFLHCMYVLASFVEDCVSL